MWHGYAETCRRKVTSHVVGEFNWYLDENGDSKCTE